MAGYPKTWTYSANLEEEAETAAAKTKELAAQMADVAKNINNFSGLTDTEKIQNALDSGGVIMIPKKKDDSEYIITTSLLIGNNTTLIINDCTLFLDDGVNDSIIHNSDFDNGNENIEIIGIGNARIDCNGDSQDRTLDNYKNIGLHLYNVTNFRISNLRVKETAKWGLVPERCIDGKLNDIYFEQNGVVNQDGIHIIGPSENIACDGVFGTLGDDACVCNGRDNPPQAYGSGGSVRGITFNNVNIAGYGNDSRTGILRTSAGITNEVKGVVLNNAIGKNISEAACRIGGGEATNSSHQRNIIINNVHLVTGNTSGASVTEPALVKLIQSAGHIIVSNCKINADDESTAGIIFNNNDFDCEDITISNCSIDLKEFEAGYVFQFKRATIKNVNINNINIKSVGSATTDGILILDSDISNMNINNVNCENIADGITIDALSNLDNVRISNINMLNSGKELDTLSNNGLTFNGYSKETANSELPTNARHEVGDFIDFVDSGDGSGNGFYLKTGNNIYKTL